MSLIVIDAEDTRALELARRVKARLKLPSRLSSDSAGASQFVLLRSAEGGSGPRHSAAWVYPSAKSGSRDLALALQRALKDAGSAAGGIATAEIASLRPDAVGGEVDACAIEVDRLSTAHGAALDAMAATLARGIERHERSRSRRYGLPVDSGGEETDAPMLTTKISPNVALRWNVAPMNLAAVDLLLHFHGNGLTTIKDKADKSGCNFNDPHAASLDDPPRRDRPTLGLIPAGVMAPGGMRFIEVSRDSTSLDAFLSWGLDRMATGHPSQNAGTLTRDGCRFILTAHSAGGQDLERVLGFADPDEVEMFDCTYYGTGNTIAWALRRLRADASALAGKARGDWDGYMREHGGSLRGIFITKTRTANRAEPIHNALECALGSLPNADLRDYLRSFYRMELVPLDQRGGPVVQHGDIPPTYGWQLLVNAAADLTPTLATPMTLGCKVVPPGQRVDLSDLQVAAALDEGGDGEWIRDTDRSALERIPDADQREHFLHEVDWEKEHFPRGGNARDRDGEPARLFRAMANLVPERRVPSLVRWHDVRAEVVQVPGQRGALLWPAAADAFGRMARAASDDGVTLTIGSAYRTPEEQEAFRKKNPNPNAVAQTRSAHEYGLAIDLSLGTKSLRVHHNSRSMSGMVRLYRTPAYKWMMLNGARFGFYPYRMEPWHWEYNPRGLADQFERGEHAEAASRAVA